MNSTDIYGYDRFMVAITNGSIVRFHSAEGVKTGHIWRNQYTNNEWVVSFNHPYSETSQHASKGFAYRVIGNISSPADEALMRGFYK